MRPSPDTRYSYQDPVSTGMRGRCPRCGEGDLFKGLKVKERCTACGLDYSFSDEGDGPTAFIILGIGAIVLGAALYVELNFEPALWVHILIWLPLTLLLCLPAIRMVKGILICQQYVTNAAEGRLSSESDKSSGNSQ